jgi:hypothetical protein
MNMKYIPGSILRNPAMVLALVMCSLPAGAAGLQMYAGGGIAFASPGLKHSMAQEESRLSPASGFDGSRVTSGPRPALVGGVSWHWGFDGPGHRNTLLPLGTDSWSAAVGLQLERQTRFVETRTTLRDPDFQLDHLLTQEEHFSMISVAIPLTLRYHFTRSVSVLAGGTVAIPLPETATVEFGTTDQVYANGERANPLDAPSTTYALNLKDELKAVSFGFATGLAFDLGPNLFCETFADYRLNPLESDARDMGGLSTRLVMGYRLEL